MASHPHSDCQWMAKNGLPCSAPAFFKVDRGSLDPKLACHAHGIGAQKLGMAIQELPQMLAVHCHSGDTWVVCDRHRGMFSMFSSKGPKRVRTAVACEGCSVDRDAR